MKFSEIEMINIIHAELNEPNVKFMNIHLDNLFGKDADKIKKLRRSAMYKKLREIEISKGDDNKTRNTVSEDSTLVIC